MNKFTFYCHHVVKNITHSQVRWRCYVILLFTKGRKKKLLLVMAWHIAQVVLYTRCPPKLLFQVPIGHCSCSKGHTALAHSLSNKHVRNQTILCSLTSLYLSNFEQTTRGIWKVSYWPCYSGSPILSWKKHTWYNGHIVIEMVTKPNHYNDNSVLFLYSPVYLVYCFSAYFLCKSCV